MRTGVSLAFIALGIGVLSAAITAAVLQTRRKGTAAAAGVHRARTIVAAAALAAAFVTIGVVIHAR